ncbi:hypothetical protein LOTGIDRAFT_238954 [Lottia gigantea]|uniref:GH16 domain-containing protein n=1 Tax=Lottia gigantea TaxID=225164 RepID=V4AVG8_LOTGI|nr:hypothetical protein LOTGIDRAFT_238954 [Lottia gigantea]ESO99025.1 hypothetical protein LOTGIDRAFT_238954 [Lottia gigantea]
MVLLPLLCLLPVLVFSTSTPTIKPRVNIAKEGSISVYVHDEVNVQSMDIKVTFFKPFQLHNLVANFNKVTSEWWIKTPVNNLEGVKSFELAVFYYYHVENNHPPQRKIYTETIFLNQETGLQPQPHQMSKREVTVLFDDFNGNQLNMNNWMYEVTASGGGNGEFQVYTPEATNTFLKNGILHLKPTFTADRFGENFLNNGKLDVKGQWGSCTASFNNGCYRTGSNIPPIMSSKIISKVKISHGRVEVLAKIPVGDWIWPAIWLLPPGGTGVYGSWPNSGEIDIMESRGNLNLKDGQGHIQGVKQTLSTIHFGNGRPNHRQHGHWKLKTDGSTWADDYHLYAVDWTQDRIKCTVDGNPVLDWKTPPEGYWKHENFSGNNLWANGGPDAPFDGKFDLILNVAVGGTGGFFPDGWNNGADGKPWKDSTSTVMKDFWNSRSKWQQTWHGDDVAMKVKYVKMVRYN